MSLEERREPLSFRDIRPPDDRLARWSLAVVWEVLSYFAPSLGIPAFAIPSFVRIGQSLMTITPLDVVVTLARVIGALILSFVIGVVLAMLMYRSESVENYLRPLIRLLMAVPVVSWILFAVLWFRGVEFRIGFVLVAVCGPVFLVDTLDAMRGVSRDLRQMIRSFRPTSLQFFRKLMLPAIVPGLLTSWKINLSLAIRVVTIAELVGAVTGIGHQLAVAQELFSVADVFAWTLVLVALLFLLEAVVARVERRAVAMARVNRSAIRSRSLGCARSSARPPAARRWWRSTGSTCASSRARSLAIVGQTGCGKSTFFDLLIGLEAPTAGSIVIGGKTPYGDFDHFRGQIATVFQQDRLFPWRSSLDNVRLPLELLRLPEAEQRRRALEWLERLGLAHFADAYPARIVRRHAPARRDRARVRGAAEHPARRRGVRSPRRSDGGGTALHLPGACARVRLDRDPHHAPARRGDRGRRPHRRVRQGGGAARRHPRRGLAERRICGAARGDPGDAAGQQAGCEAGALVGWA